METPQGTQVYGTPGKSAWTEVEQALAGPIPRAGGQVTYARAQGNWARFRRGIIITLVASFALLLVSALANGSPFPLSLLLSLVALALFFTVLGAIPWQLWKSYTVARRIDRAHDMLRRRGHQFGPADTGSSAGGLPGEEVQQVINEFRRTRNPTLIPERVRTWAYGALGEEEVGATLGNLGRGWSVAHDLEVRDGTGRVRANIDHLVSGPCGVVMVDAKRWKGLLVQDGQTFGSMDEANGKWVQNPQTSAIRAKSPETLRWEASNVPGGVHLIVVAVSGGKVAGDAVVLRTPGTVPVVAVPVSKLVGYLQGLPPTRRGGRDVSALVRGPLSFS